MLGKYESELKHYRAKALVQYQHIEQSWLPIGLEFLSPICLLAAWRDWG